MGACQSIRTMKSLRTTVQGLLLCFCSIIVMDANPGVSDCCHEKKVGDKVYTLITASNETSKFGCDEACIYRNKIKPGSRFCFAKGNLKSKCQRKTNCKCGVKKKGTRIIDGQEAEVNEYPWLARVLSRWNAKGQVWFEPCGGSLIASRWVLTASHCIPFPGIPDAENGTVIVILGSHDINNNPVPGVKDMSKSVYASDWFLHPYFNKFFPNDNDIALVYLESPVDINIYTPVCLPYTKLDLEITGRTAWLAGWGANSSYKDDPNDPEADWQFTEPESLMEKQLMIEDRFNCFDHIQKEGRFISMGMICANTTNFEGEKNAGQCSGDSGGPLTVEDKDGRHVIVGDVSFGPRPCEAINSIGVYGNVAFYRVWIEHTMKMMQGEEPERCDDDYFFDFQ